MSDALQQFNAHQEDVRRRADSLVRAMFLLSGGALTVSIGIFTKQEALPLSPGFASVLSYSWWSLFLSILLLVLCLVAIISRDYAFGERWRRAIDRPGSDEPGQLIWPEILIWSLAVGGLVTFSIGMLGLAWVATGLVKGM